MAPYLKGMSLLIPQPSPRLSSIPVGQRECGVDPAVGVHDSGGDVVDDAVDGVADEGLGGDEEVGGQDEEHGRLAVQLEHRIVDRYLHGPVSNHFQFSECRVTHHVGPNIPLTPKPRRGFSTWASY